MSKKEGLTEIVVVLDETGSMQTIKSDTIGGFNQFLYEQKKEEGEAIMSLYFFSYVGTEEKIRQVYSGIPLDDIADLTDSSYRPRGVTPLWDAVGCTIDSILERHKSLKKKQRPDLTIFVVMTDGYENASVEYTVDQVKKKVQNVQKKGWKFLCVGAGIDAWAGIGHVTGVAASTQSYGRKQVKMAYAGVSGQTSSLRQTGHYTDWDKTN